MQPQKRALSKQNIESAFRVMGIWPMNHRHVLFHPDSQAITTTAAYTTRATSGNLNVQMINQLELHVYKMTDKNEILTITTQLASIARTESAHASVSTHLLETRDVLAKMTEGLSVKGR
jgi:hypothetical protein